MTWKRCNRFLLYFFHQKMRFLSVLTRGVKNKILGPNNYLFQLKKRILKIVNALSKMVKNCLSYRVFHVTIADADTFKGWGLSIDCSPSICTTCWWKKKRQRQKQNKKPRKVIITHNIVFVWFVCLLFLLYFVLDFDFVLFCIFSLFCFLVCVLVSLLVGVFICLFVCLFFFSKWLSIFDKVLTPFWKTFL